MDIFVLGILFTNETAYFGILFTTETADHTIHIKSKAEKGFLVFLRFVVFCFLYFEMVHSSSGSQRKLSEFYFVFCILEWSIPVADPDFHVSSDKAVVRI